MNPVTLSKNALQVLKGCNVLYVDRSLVALNKPAGLIVQGTKSTDLRKTASTIQPILDELQVVLEQKEPLRTIHRLDKDTTGVLLLGRNPRIVHEVQKQMTNGSVRKTYLAVVHNGPRLESGKGTITVPLCIDANGAVTLGGKADAGSKVQTAVTHWERVSQSEEYPCSLLKLGLETGRKHQIRVHLAHDLRSPIMGDGKYGAPEDESHRYLLHCFEMSLLRYKKDGPKKRFTLAIRAPVPADIKATCQKLRLELPPGLANAGVFIDGEVAEVDDLLHYTGGQQAPWKPESSPTTPFG